MASLKSKHVQGQGREQAFTLLELLIAIALFAIVIGTVYGVYRSTFTTVSATAESIAIANSGRRALQLIIMDLANLRFGPGGYLASEEKELQGKRADQLTFVTERHLQLRREDHFRGNALVQYEVKEEEDGSRALYRSESIILPGAEKADAAPSYLVCSGLGELAFTFSGQEQQEENSWRSGESELQEVLDQGAVPELPSLIAIKLRLQRDGDETNDMIFTTAVATAAPHGN